MEVLLANEYGFCFGVERAVEMVEDALEGGGPVRTLGPLIHNTQVMQRLECEGVSTVQDPSQVSKDEIAVIRAHGVTPLVQLQLEARAAQVGEVEKLPLLHAPLVVSQTTLKLKTFIEVAEAVRAKADAEPEIVNTICSATRDRQDAARALAGLVDVFYIIGGKHSSNSIKLLAVCKEQCERSFLIETEGEINPEDLAGVDRVGVTAGASTPNWLIDQVVARLREIGNRNANQETRVN